MRSRLRPLLGLATGVVLVLVVTVVVVFTAMREGPASCPVGTESLSLEQPVLVPAGELAPGGSVGRTRRPTLEAAAALGSPFDGLVSGRFYDRGDQVPGVVKVAGAMGLVGDGEVLAAQLPDGAPLWGESFDGAAVTGGLVVDAVVLLVNETSSTALAYDAAEGGLVGCVAIPTGGEGPATALKTDQAGEQVVVAAGSEDAPVRLSLLEPRTGVVWDRELESVSEVGSVYVADDVVVLSPVGLDPVRLGELAASGSTAQPQVTAYALDDGAEAWSHPSADEPPGAATVVDVHDETGRLAVLTVTAEAGEGSGQQPGKRPQLDTRQQPESRVSVLGPDGRTEWTRRLGTGPWAGEIWGDTVVMQGPAAGPGTVLRAFGLEDGARRWRLAAGALDGKAAGVSRFGPGVQVGGRYVATAPGGLIAVEPRSGRFRQLRTDLEIDEIVPIGDHVVLRSDTALLVLDVVDGVGVAR